MPEMSGGLKDDFHEACRCILAEPKNPGNMPYGKAYAEAGLEMNDAEEIRVRCLYIVGNLSHWRGDEAKRVRSLLKSLGKR